MQPLFAYFAAEKRGAMVLLVGGVISVGTASALMMAHNVYAARRSRSSRSACWQWVSAQGFGRALITR